MKKVCYVVTIPLTIRAFFIPQLKYLADNGYDVTVICSNDSKIKNDLGESINYIPLDIPRGISFYGSIKTIWQLIGVFKKNNFDLIQYSTPNAAFYASIASRIVGCKIRNYHLMGLRYLGATGIVKSILKAIEKIACYNSTSIECVSKSNIKMGIKEGLFPRKKVSIVWNGSTGGVDIKRFDYKKRLEWREEVRKTLGFTDEDFVFGFVGRITRDKGVNEIINAFNSLSGDSKLLLIGSMDEINTLDLKLLEKAKKNKDILFHDSVNDIERYYAAIDVLLLPSYREGFGNVVIEAGAMGTPAIISNIPGPIDTVVPGKTAYLVPSHDSNKLANAMEQIMQIDYRSMGNNAYQFAKKHFDSDVLCEKIYERKEQLLKKRLYN